MTYISANMLHIILYLTHFCYRFWNSLRSSKAILILQELLSLKSDTKERERQGENDQWGATLLVEKRGHCMHSQGKVT